MGLQTWLASLPGVAFSVLLGYLGQRHLQRLVMVRSHKATHYLDLIALMNEHNGQMWKRYELRLPSSEPYPPALTGESHVTRRTELLASPAVRVALSHLLGAIVDWREQDEQRLDPDPHPASRLGKYPNLPEWFGYRTPGQEAFERAGDEADDCLSDLCEVIRRELNPRARRSWSFQGKLSTTP